MNWLRPLCLILLLLPLCLTAEDWSGYKQQDGVTVEYRRHSDGVLEIKAQLTLKSLTGAFLHLLNDTAAISDWVANAKRVEILASPASNTNIVHTYFSAIWPVSPRDMVTQSIWKQNTDGVLYLRVTDLGGQYPQTDGYVRMQQVEALWTLTPLADGSLHIQYQGQADPAGKVPHFIANRVALKAMFDTFRNLRKVLPKYQQAYPDVIEQS